MSSNFAWPKDTAPNVITQANRLASMSKPEVIENLKAAQLQLNQRLWKRRFGSLSTRISSDLVSSDMLRLANASGKADAKLILQLFVYLFDEAADLERLLENSEDSRRSFLLKDFQTTVSALFKGRQIIDEGLFLFYSRNPAELKAYLRLGFAESARIWATLHTDEDKRKFIVDVFDSPKGYPKTARSVEEWTPPSAVNLTARLTEWLRAFSNTSIFTGMSSSKTVTNLEQIQEHYAKATPKEKDYFWFSVIFQISQALGLDDGDAIGSAITRRVSEIEVAFRPTAAASDLASYGPKAKAIWTSIMG